MLFEKRERFSLFSEKLGMAFSRIPLKPNTWTLLSLVTAALALYFMIRNDFLAASFLVILTGFIDIIDGAVARARGEATKRGAYLDTIADRYAEAIMLLGLLFVQLPTIFMSSQIWVFIYFLGAFMTTYAKAAASEKDIGEVKGGFLERAERIVILFIGLFMAQFSLYYLLYAVIILAVLSNVSALQRICKALNMSRGR
jgi:archaetidylinositol phosphate synthase